MSTTSTASTRRSARRLRLEASKPLANRIGTVEDELADLAAGRAAPLRMPAVESPARYTQRAREIVRAHEAAEEAGGG